MTLGSSLSLSATTSPAVPPPAKETTEERQEEEDPERTNVELTYDNIVGIEGNEDLFRRTGRELSFFSGIL